MRVLVLLGAFLVMASSCRRYETCDTYAKNTEVKTSVQDYAKEKKETI